MNNIHLIKYDTENLGDDIQTIAVMDIMQDLKLQYSFVNRDLINGYFFNPLKNNYIIFNGWFTNGYGLDGYYNTSDDYKHLIQVTWPPKGNFKSVLYSFHISEWGPRENRGVHPSFLYDSVDFYKSGGTVGCRDTHTLNILKSLDVDAYFSGCITLSFDKNKYYKENSPHNEVLFVDVPEIHKEKLIQKTAEYYNGGVGFKNLTHTISPLSVDLLDRFTLARRHLEAFCNAKLVFTSRLHVALPCLAFGTPVIFVADENELENSRIVDYIKYMNVLTHDDIEECNIGDMLTDKFDRNLSNEVKTKFEQIMTDLFLNEDKG